jgi:hypothetical protein
MLNQCSSWFDSSTPAGKTEIPVTSRPAPVSTHAELTEFEPMSKPRMDHVATFPGYGKSGKRRQVIPQL